MIDPNSNTIKKSTHELVRFVHKPEFAEGCAFTGWSTGPFVEFILAKGVFDEGTGKVSGIRALYLHEKAVGWAADAAGWTSPEQVARLRASNEKLAEVNRELKRQLREAATAPEKLARAERILELQRELNELASEPAEVVELEPVA